MKYIVQTAAIFCAALALFSCAVQKPATPSGRPEITISTSLKKAQAVVIDTMASNGFALTNQTSNSLTFEQDLPPDQAALFLVGMGNSHYSHPKSVTRFIFVPSGGQVRIFGTSQASAQGPFGQVKSLDLTGGKSGMQLQTLLEIIKRRAD